MKMITNGTFNFMLEQIKINNCSFVYLIHSSTVFKWVVKCEINLLDESECAASLNYKLIIDVLPLESFLCCKITWNR